MFIGDGAKLVRDAFQLAKENSPCIIFIDEIDAIGTKRFDSEVSGDREVQRTMLELLNQLDGFSSDDRIKVIAATNRADILDPALMRSGRLDRKIEFPHPSEEARARILQIHSRKMNVHPDVNFEELARSTDDFNGAQLKAVCVEAGMLALRRDATEFTEQALTKFLYWDGFENSSDHPLLVVFLLNKGRTLAMEFLSSMTSTVVEQLIVPIRRSVTRVFNYSRNVKGLKTHIEELSDAKTRVLHSVDEARNRSEDIEDDVRTWLASVNVITEEANRVFGDEDKATKRCFMGLFPNVTTRYKVV
ncbi:hypothetical protein D5086_024066 [Populus alba]|uniref:Uncharacterized protein n=1 Tax=Populus alba TaxID=43335 RepID=A0ACC4B664_POPAL